MQDDLLPITEGPGRDELAKLYSWTWEEAMKAQELWDESKHPSMERGPLFKWIGAEILKRAFDRYQNGNKRAILDALFQCSMNDLAIPKWCALGLLEAIREVYQFNAGSWDEVFGRAHPKGTHLAAKRQKWEKAHKVYYMIKKIKRDDPSVPIDGYLFETVGKELGIGGKTLIEEYYYEVKNNLKKK